MSETESDRAPRWRDCHALPDAWLIAKTRRVRRHLPQPVRSRIGRYATRFVHCDLDGQCYLRRGHRGGCDWGE